MKIKKWKQFNESQKDFDKFYDVDMKKLNKIVKNWSNKSENVSWISDKPKINTKNITYKIDTQGENIPDDIETLNKKLIIMDLKSKYKNEEIVITEK